MKQWKDIKGFEGFYQVSNNGLVRSLDRVDSSGRNLKGKYLSLNSLSGSGYAFVSLSKFNIPNQRYIHQLVAEAFLNHTVDGHGMVVDHIDNNKLNNIVKNLQVITSRENSSKEKRSTNRYTGVRKTPYNTYRAEIRVNGKKVCLGSHKCETKAYVMYQKKLNEVTA